MAHLCADKGWALARLHVLELDNRPQLSFHVQDHAVFEIV
jgi:hypothetical protein